MINQIKFMKLLKFFTIDYFLNTSLWKNVIRLSPRLKGYPKFRLEHYFVIREILREDPDGFYCFVGCDNRSVAIILQRVFYRIWWGHSGFIELSEDGEVYISHVRQRLRYDNLLYYLKEADNFALLKLPLTEEEKKLAKTKIKKLHESEVTYKVRDNLNTLKQYSSEDYWLHHDKFHFYCSEYQYFVCMGMMDNPAWDFGKKRFTTDDLYKSSIVVFED